MEKCFKETESYKVFLSLGRQARKTEFQRGICIYAKYAVLKEGLGSYILAQGALMGGAQTFLSRVLEQEPKGKENRGDAYFV